MPLYIVGSGLSADYLTLKAISVLHNADKVYVDTYTSIAPGVDAELVKRLAPKAIVVAASRRLLEDEAYRVIEEAKKLNVVILVPGDPMIATTHVSILVEALKRGVSVEVVPGVSGVYAAISVTGLHFYRFGKPVTLVYPEEYYKPFSVIETIYDNYDRGLHTLILLDLRLDEGKAMTIPEALRILIELEKSYEASRHLMERVKLVGVARAGLPDQYCAYGNISQLASKRYPPPPHSLIVLAERLHPVEEEALRLVCSG